MSRRRSPERPAAGDVAKQTRDKIYANIAAFKAKAVAWFKTTADKNRFKARLTTMRSGFKQMYSADERPDERVSTLSA